MTFLCHLKKKKVKLSKLAFEGLGIHIDLHTLLKWHQKLKNRKKPSACPPALHGFCDWWGRELGTCWSLQELFSTPRLFSSVCVSAVGYNTTVSTLLGHICKENSSVSTLLLNRGGAFSRSWGLFPVLSFSF